jgi:transketolase
MRETLHKFLTRYPGEIYLLHCDLWKWPEGNYTQINCGVQEPNMINIAAGLASQGKRVIIYGVAGFVIYKAYEQMKLNIKGWAENYGSIVFVNAGANGAYKICGRGHLLDDDALLMQALDIPLYDPIDRSTFMRNVKEGLQSTGVRYIRLGWDNEVWRKK